MINIPYTEYEIQRIIETHCISNKISPYNEIEFDIDDYGLPYFDTSDSIDDVIEEHLQVLKQIESDLKQIKNLNSLMIEIFSLGYKKGLEDGRVTNAK